MTIVYTHVGPAPVPERARRMRVRTRDGVHLATDVYLVDGEIAPRPVVLTRTPYDIGSDFGVIPAIAEYFNQAGYHFVAQDVRGKFNSEGHGGVSGFFELAARGDHRVDAVSDHGWALDGRGTRPASPSAVGA